jgi:hypothetical protein
MIRARLPALPGRLRRAACVAVAIACAAPAWAQQPAGSADAWRFSLTPYVWLPTINADLAFPLPGGGGGGGGGQDGSFATEIGPNQYLTNLDFALMLNAQARRGPWSLMADYIGLRMSGERSTVRDFTIGGTLLPGPRPGVSVDTGTTTSLRADLWNLVGGHSVSDDAAHPVDVVAGVRLGRLASTVDWRLSASLGLPDGTPALDRTGSAGVSKNVTDAIVGLRGTWKIDARWSVPWYVDVGAGTSQLTWQALIGAAYAFGWGELSVAWRHLSVKGDGGSAFESVSLSGPSIGATFRF